MTNLEDTAEIPSIPRPTNLLWLGVTAAGGAVSWLVTVVTILGTRPTTWELQATGLCMSTTITVLAALTWARYSLAKTMTDNQRHFANLRAGQHALLVAEIRSLRVVIEQAAGAVTAEQQSAGAKLTKIINEMPTYWHGVADEMQREIGDGANIHVINQHRGPHR